MANTTTLRTHLQHQIPTYRFEERRANVCMLEDKADPNHCLQHSKTMSKDSIPRPLSQCRK